MVPFALALAALLALVATRQRRRSSRPAQAVIVSPRRSTVFSKEGGVRSVQTAELTMARTDLERLWTPQNIENLARTYWRFLSRVTLGLVRVVYTETERAVVLIAQPLTMLRFDAPEYLMEPDHANVRWRIRGGLLVTRARRGSGYLSLDVTREKQADGDRAKLRIEVEVANFYPSIAHTFSQPVYKATQSTIHVLVTHAFLRSLAKLDLAESKVGRFAGSLDGEANPLQSRSDGTAHEVGAEGPAGAVRDRAASAAQP